VSGFDWDDYNREHVLDHGVEPHEAESALEDPDALGAEAQNRGEQRWAVLGATEEGRLLVVVFTRRGSLVRVVTARQASANEGHRYRKRRKRA
jgi:uncharacterized DUF497 family protein